jgi:hypothetical protein
MTLPMTKVKTRASGDGVAMFIIRKPELTAEQRDSTEWRQLVAGVWPQHVPLQ